MVLSYNDGMEYQSALYVDYILSRGAYLRGFIQNENTNLMSTKFNKQRIWKESHEICLICQYIYHPKCIDINTYTVCIMNAESM